MSRVEILKCDGCGEVMPNVPTRGRATLIVYNIESEEELDLCPGCVSAVKGFLQDVRMPMCDAPAPPKPTPHHPGTMGVQAR